MSNAQTSTTAVEVLQRYGLTVKDVLDNPEEILDVPPPFPPGRKYHFAANREVALIVNEHGILVSSLPGHKALESIENYKQSKSNDGIFNSGVGWTIGDKSLDHVWAVQHLISPKGVLTVHQVNDSRAIAILLDQKVLISNIVNLHWLEDDDRLTQLGGLSAPVIELAWFIQGCIDEDTK